jgi:hypothetical protein
VKAKLIARIEAGKNIAAIGNNTKFLNITFPVAKCNTLNSQNYL